MNPNIISVNDLVVLDEDEFYATNDHYFGFMSKLVRFFETLSLVFILICHIICDFAKLSLCTVSYESCHMTHVIWQMWKMKTLVKVWRVLDQ